MLFHFVMINSGRISSCLVVLVHGTMLICFILLLLLPVIIFCSVCEMNSR